MTDFQLLLVVVVIFVIWLFNSLNVLREYNYPDGKLAARERVVYEGDALVSFELEDFQTGARGSAGRGGRGPRCPLASATGDLGRQDQCGRG